MEDETSEGVRRDLARNVTRKLKGVPLSNTFDFRVLRPFALGFVFLSLIFYIYALFSPQSTLVSLKRAILPSEQILPPTSTKIERIEPGNTKILKGQPVDLWVKLAGELPKSATLTMSHDESTWTEKAVSVSANGISKTQVDRLIRPLDYYFIAGDARSARHRIDVREVPAITELQGNYEYPEYTGLEASSFEDGNLTAVVGTIARVEAEANVPLKSAQAVFIDGERIAAQLSGNRISFGFEIKKNSYYWLELKDKEDFENPNPPRYEINAQEDLPPDVSLIVPEGDLELRVDQSLEIVARIHDDFGISECHLLFKPRFEDERLIRIPVDEGSADAKPSASFSLASLSLSSGDTATFSIVVQDNRKPEPNRGETETYSLSVLRAQQTLIAMADLAGQSDSDESDDGEEEI
ncbi:MAG: hypothetical protein QF886_24645, partial [Planctomycetota bacterium]|nr:hypothetical protein [Planctomycetota bacterium]